MTGEQEKDQSPGNEPRRLRVAITHVRLGWGGSEKRVLWSIQALKDHHDVTLITAGSYDLAALNNYYGTDLGASDFHSIQVPLPFFLRSSSRMAAIRGALFQRFCRKIAKDYDVLISGYGPTDFGRPAIHFIADFSWDKEMREALHPYPPGMIYNNRRVRSVYIKLVQLLSKPSGRDLFAGGDLMLSVSPWVSQVMRERFGTASPVLPSPVPGKFPPIPWERKQYGFVCLGRLSPEKRIEDIIEILSAVRHKGHDIHLHIIGVGGNEAYVDSIRLLARQHGSWINMEGLKQGKEKAALLAEHAFGIHACRGDAFPGALIEMMKAGCVVWAHNSGGQPDILQTPELLYEDKAEAVKKIDQLLREPERLKPIQGRLQQLSEKYAVERYISDIRQIVEDWSRE
ncbi:glycosyltransferase family 4 protein [Thiolapillus sp.]